ncbi:MAG TPA: hypothetical protein VFW92_12020 [Candidatus Limnocylindrales bacterium]|nr:hypothetical protein [Candidatus Limnocylindrales bacterium]
MNVQGLIVVVVFGGALLAIFGLIYRQALASYRQGELGPDGIRLLQWAIVGQLVIYALLGLTAFLT